MIITIPFEQDVGCVSEVTVLKSGDRHRLKYEGTLHATVPCCDIKLRYPLIENILYLPNYFYWLVEHKPRGVVAR